MHSQKPVAEAIYLLVLAAAILAFIRILLPMILYINNNILHIPYVQILFFLGLSIRTVGIGILLFFCSLAYLYIANN